MLLHSHSHCPPPCSRFPHSPPTALCLDFWICPGTPRSTDLSPWSGLFGTSNGLGSSGSLFATTALPYFQPWFGWSCSGSTKGRSLFVDDPKRKGIFSQSLLPRLFFARADQPMITQGMGISWFMRWSPLALLVHTVIHAQTGHERMFPQKKTE